MAITLFSNYIFKTFYCNGIIKCSKCSNITVQVYSVEQREGTHRPVVDVPDPAGERGGAAQDGRHVAGVRQDKLGPSEASVSPLHLERQSRVSWAGETQTW